MLEPIQRSSVADAVLDQLLRLLKSGTLKPGDRLPTEQELMKQLGVSRPPIREALNALVGMGVVEKRQGSGHYLRAVRLNHILSSEATAFLDLRGQIAEVVEARMFLEVEVIAKVVREASDGDIRRLRDWLDDMERISADGRYTPEQSAEFHTLLARLAKSSVLYQLMVFLIGLGLQEEDALLLPYFNPQEDLQLHRKLVDAIEQRDEQRARQAMREHIASRLDRLGRLKTAKGEPDASTSQS